MSINWPKPSYIQMIELHLDSLNALRIINIARKFGSSEGVITQQVSHLKLIMHCGTISDGSNPSLQCGHIDLSFCVSCFLGISYLNY